MNRSSKMFILSIILLSSPLMSTQSFAQSLLSIPVAKMFPVSQFSEGGSATHGKASASEGGSATHGVAAAEGGSATHGGQDIYKISLGNFKKEDLMRVRSEILLMSAFNKEAAIEQFEKTFKSMTLITKEYNWMKKNAENALSLSKKLQLNLTTSDVADIEEMILVSLDYHFMKTLQLNESKAESDFNFLKSMTITKNEKAFLVNKETRALLFKAVFNSILNDFNLRTVDLKDQTPEALDSLNIMRTKLSNLSNASENEQLSEYLKLLSE